MRGLSLVSTALAVALMAAPGYAGAAEITDFSGPWFKTTAGGGTADIVDLTGLGGNLENNAPLPTGAVRMTTTANPDRADIGRGVGDPLVRNIFNGDLSFSYSIFKQATTNLFAAPALKLTFFNGAFVGDGFVQLIFEPTWNMPGDEGSSTAVTTGDWLTFSIDLGTGLFWNTGGFGQTNSAGGPPLRTLQDWSTEFDSAFLDAALTGVGIGQGTFNADTTAYFDDVNVAFTDSSFSADFEATAIPEPASLALFGFGLAALGASAWARRRRPAAVPR